MARKSKYGLWGLPRRDMCHVIGRRAQKLSPEESAYAWQMLGRQLEQMGDLDMPKFKHLITTIRAATVCGRQITSK